MTKRQQRDAIAASRWERVERANDLLSVMVPTGAAPGSGARAAGWFRFEMWLGALWLEGARGHRRCYHSRRYQIHTISVPDSVLSDLREYILRAEPLADKVRCWPVHLRAAPGFWPAAQQLGATKPEDVTP